MRYLDIQDIQITTERMDLFDILIPVGRNNILMDYKYFFIIWNIHTYLHRYIMVLKLLHLTYYL